MSTSSDPESISNLLEKWIVRALTADLYSWVSERKQVIEKEEKQALFLAFGLASRKVGKRDLVLSEKDLAEADRIRSRWRPVNWTVDQAVRTLFVLSYPSTSSSKPLATLDQLFVSGEIRELVALYQMLPLFPYPDQHLLRAAEGVRTNMKSVFCAVAHHNAYPFEEFLETAWNQMILKCLFIEVALAPVVGLDERANATLACMLCDYAHERWAAGRMVSPELWRCVGPFANDAALRDLERVLHNGEEIEQRAAALSLSQCPKEEAKQILKSRPELVKEIAEGKIEWEQFTERETST